MIGFPVTNMSVQTETYRYLDYLSDNMNGVNSSLVLTNQVNEVRVVDNLYHQMIVNRVSGSIIADTDEIINLGDIALFEDQNRLIGHMTCEEDINFIAGHFIKNCTVASTYNMFRNGIVYAKDFRNYEYVGANTITYNLVVIVTLQ